jgi:hypothetical protein
MDQTQEERQGLLKKALTGNALFSVISGAAILLANRWLVKFLGLPDQVSLALLGISLLVYAILLWLNARKANIKITGAWVAIVMDVVWVVASYALIVVVPFSVGGKWVVVLVAELVLAFAVLQWMGVRRLLKSGRSIKGFALRGE